MATRELLVESLLERLQADFAANRGTTAELEGLLETLQQKTAFLRIVAAGLQKSGERLPAFEAFLKLASLEPGSSEPDQIDDTLLVRRDRWVQVRLAELRAAATEAERQKMDDLVSAKIAAAGPDPSLQGERLAAIVRQSAGWR